MLPTISELFWVDLLELIRCRSVQKREVGGIEGYEGVNEVKSREEEMGWGSGILSNLIRSAANPLAKIHLNKYWSSLGDNK